MTTIHLHVLDTSPDNKKFTLMLSADNILRDFTYFFQEIGFDISCKLSPLETICMKCQSLFSGEKKKNILSLLSIDYPQRMVIKG